MHFNSASNEVISILSVLCGIRHAFLPAVNSPSPAASLLPLFYFSAGHLRTSFTVRLPCHSMGHETAFDLPAGCEGIHHSFIAFPSHIGLSRLDSGFGGWDGGGLYNGRSGIDRSGRTCFIVGPHHWKHWTEA